MTRVIYTNCHERWVLVVPEMAQNKDWKITPYSKHDEETHRWWKTKWSDMHSGKVEGAGWKPGAFTAFNSHLREIIALRELDSKRGWKLYKYCKKLVREKHGVKEKVATNKRKRKGQAPTESKLGPWWTSYRAPLSKVNTSNNYICALIQQSWSSRRLTRWRKTGVSTVTAWERLVRTSQTFLRRRTNKLSEEEDE